MAYNYYSALCILLLFIYLSLSFIIYDSFRYHLLSLFAIYLCFYVCINLYGFLTDSLETLNRSCHTAQLAFSIEVTLFVSLLAQFDSQSRQRNKYFTLIFTYNLIFNRTSFLLLFLNFFKLSFHLFAGTVKPPFISLLVQLNYHIPLFIPSFYLSVGHTPDIVTIILLDFVIQTTFIYHHSSLYHREEIQIVFRPVGSLVSLYFSHRRGLSELYPASL